MTTRVTQCPNCSTAFRVTDAQLQVAKGAVRCGSCLQIFDATRHWTDKAVSQPAPQAPTPPAGEDEDDLRFDDDTPLFDDTEENPALNDGLFLEEDSGDAGSEEQPSQDEEERFLELDDWEEEPKSIFRELDELGDDAYESGDEQWAKQLLEEMESEETPQQEDEEEAEFGVDDELLAQVPEVERPPEELEELLQAVDEYEPPPAAEQRDEDELLLGSMEAGERIGDESQHQVLPHFEPEPLQFGGHGRRSRTPLLYGAASVLALLLLAAQYVYFNFDRLARGEQREWLGLLCSGIGCELPALTDLTAIRSHNLIVRSHPELRGALVVDAIVTNSARFAQPFPLLELRFTDLEGNVVASRRFAPEEYLGGELRGHTAMPSRQPIHVSLEIVDPGQKALNYEINFAPQVRG